MSSTWTITGTDGTVYTVVTDTTTTYSAVVTGVVTDEIFGGFDWPGLEVVLTRKDLQTKTTVLGQYAITGYPSRAFSVLPSSLSFTLKAPGFRDYPVTVPIPASASFPVSAAATAMRRLPVRLQGRVVSDATGAPQAAAQVVSVDNPNPPSPPPPPPVPHSMLLRSPLYAAHAKNAPVQAVTLATAGSAQLTQPAAAGSTVLMLNNTTGLAGSAFVQIKSPDSVLVEYALVTSTGPAAGQAVLATALNRSYGAGVASAVNFVTATPSGSVAHLLLDANAGDGIVVADALLSAGTLVIDAGAPAVEYHESGALTDSNGYYGVDGVGRVQELFLEANSATPPTPWMVEYDQATNIVDFRI